MSVECQQTCPRNMPARSTNNSYHLVRPSPIARRLLWHVFQIGERSLRAPAQFPPHEKPGVGLLAIVSGRGELRLDSGTFKLQPGPHFWMYSTQLPRTFVPAPGEMLVTRPIWFGGPALEAWLDELDVARNPEFRLPRPIAYHRAHRQLVRLVESQPRRWEWCAH